MKFSVLTLLLALGLILSSAHAQDPGEPPKHEFRGTWISTVLNLDWPGSITPSTQRQELVTMLDRLKTAGINAVLFQVRSESDAMYPSEIDPWSRWLTGKQGQAPSPLYDPLQFAIEEAHKRGMELHAWFNPYRVQRSVGNYPVASNHVSVEHPEWTFTINNIQMLDPGQPQVRDYVSTVVSDVARRYDIDGVHFDDYFYPYPPGQISNQDDATFAAHSRGFTDRGAWRRDNVNLLVSQIHDSLNAIKPEVKFGISPFGIWKNGVPSGIVGLDAHNVIYADATAWLQAEDIDYLTPQLYWAFGGGQDYGKLAPWWATQINGRHLYPGHGLYRSDRATFANTLFGAGEIPRQVRFNRAHPDIQGSVFFRAKNITHYSSKGFADTLETDLYRYPALTPPMTWKSMVAPASPPGLETALLVPTESGPVSVELSWQAPEDSEVTAERYAVYRVRSEAEPDWNFVLPDARYMLAVTGELSYVDTQADPSEPYHYAVTAVSANSIESAPATSGVVRTASDEDPNARSLSLHGNYPNPFSDRTAIRFELDRPGAVTLQVYDLLGRRVARLADAALFPPGTHTIEWDGTDGSGRPLPAGTYLCELLSEGRRRTAMLIRLP